MDKEQVSKISGNQRQYGKVNKNGTERDNIRRSLALFDSR